VATTLDRTITVPGEPEAVFDYVADFATTEEWDPGIESARKTSQGPVGLGSEFELTAVFMGRKLRTTYRIVGYERPTEVVIKGGTNRFTSTDTLTVTPTDDERVRVGYRAVFELGGLLRFAEPLLRGTFERIADKAVAGLAEKLSG
jgi:carbon monoxide dehydrogenase subunit G